MHESHHSSFFVCPTVEFSVDGPVPLLVNTFGVECKWYIWLPPSWCLALRSGRRMTGSPLRSMPFLSPTSITSELSPGTHWKEAGGPKHQPLNTEKSHPLIGSKLLLSLCVITRVGWERNDHFFEWKIRHQSVLENHLLFSYRINLII